MSNPDHLTAVLRAVRHHRAAGEWELRPPPSADPMMEFGRCFPWATADDVTVPDGDIGFEAVLSLSLSWLDPDGRLQRSALPGAGELTFDRQDGVMFFTVWPNLFTDVIVPERDPIPWAEAASVNRSLVVDSLRCWTEHGGQVLSAESELLDDIGPEGFRASAGRPVTGVSPAAEGEDRGPEGEGRMAYPDHVVSALRAIDAAKRAGEWDLTPSPASANKPSADLVEEFLRCFPWAAVERLSVPDGDPGFEAVLSLTLSWLDLDRTLTRSALTGAGALWFDRHGGFLVFTVYPNLFTDVIVPERDPIPWTEAASVNRSLVADSLRCWTEHGGQILSAESELLDDIGPEGFRASATAW